MTALSGSSCTLLLEQMPGLYLILTPQLEIVTATDAYLEATLTKRENILGRQLFEVFPDNPNDPAATGVANLTASLQRMLKDKTPDRMPLQKYDVPRPEGGFEEKYWTPVNTPVLDEAREVAYIIHQVEDVTDLVKLRRGIDQAHTQSKDLKQQVDALKQSQHRKDEFVGMISHELRTPLQAIMGYASIMEDALDEVLTPEQLQYVRHLVSHSEILLNLINDLLDANRIQAGKFAVEPYLTDLQPIVSGVMTTVTPLAELRNVRLNANLPLELPEICLDGPRIAQVLTNLLSNALKFSPDQGVVEVRVLVQMDALRCEVRDQGPGIQEADLGRLFQPFSQLDAPLRHRVRGTGLGLNISRLIVEAHGGQIGVESQPGRGSTFWFTLPLPGASSTRCQGSA